MSPTEELNIKSQYGDHRALPWGGGSPESGSYFSTCRAPATLILQVGKVSDSTLLSRDVRPPWGRAFGQCPECQCPQGSTEMYLHEKGCLPGRTAAREHK